MWYVIQVITGKEEDTVKLCLGCLANEKIENIDFFIPHIERKIKKGGVWKTVRRVMFPGYVFVETDDPDKRFLELKKVPRFTKLLGTGYNFVAISEKEEKFIDRITDENDVAAVSIGDIEGESIIIKEGPLKGMEAMIKRIDRHKRIAELELEFMGNSVPVTMGLEIVGKSV